MRTMAHSGLRSACRQFASTVYQLDDDGYLDLHLLQGPPELAGGAAYGASACPARAISVLADAPIPERRTEDQP